MQAQTFQKEIVNRYLVQKRWLWCIEFFDKTTSAFEPKTSLVMTKQTLLSLSCFPQIGFCSIFDVFCLRKFSIYRILFPLWRRISCSASSPSTSRRRSATPCGNASRRTAKTRGNRSSKVLINTYLYQYLPLPIPTSTNTYLYQYLPLPIDTYLYLLIRTST